MSFCGLTASSFLWTNSISLNGCVVVCFSFHLLKISGFLPVFAIMNKAAINIHMQVFVWICFQISWVST